MKELDYIMYDNNIFNITRQFKKIDDNIIEYKLTEEDKELISEYFVACSSPLNYGEHNEDIYQALCNAPNALRCNNSTYMKDKEFSNLVDNYMQAYKKLTEYIF